MGDEISFIGITFGEENYSYSLYALMPATLIAGSLYPMSIFLRQALLSLKHQKDPLKSNSYSLLSRYQLIGCAFLCSVAIMIGVIRIVYILPGEKYCDYFCKDTWSVVAMAYLYYGLKVVADLIFNFIFVLQLFEYAAMWHMMAAQKNMDPEEILYNFSVKEADVNQLPAQVRKTRFRSKEKWIACALVTAVTVDAAFSLGVLTMSFVELYSTSAESEQQILWQDTLLAISILTVNILKFFAQAVVFFGVFFHMRRYHVFEFKQRRAALLSHFFVIEVFYLLRSLSNLFIDKCFIFTKDVTDPACLDNNFTIIFYRIATPFNLLCIPYLLLNYSTTFIKPMDDPFEGMSKLDNLALISIFQRSTSPQKLRSTSATASSKDPFEEKQERHKQALTLSKLMMRNTEVVRRSKAASNNQTFSSGINEGQSQPASQAEYLLGRKAYQSLDSEEYLTGSENERWQVVEEPAPLS